MPEDTAHRTHLLGLSADGVCAAVAELGVEPYRAKQVVRWVYQRGEADWSAMTDLPAATRGKLAERFTVLLGDEVQSLRASDATRKLLIAWPPRKTNLAVTPSPGQVADPTPDEAVSTVGAPTALPMLGGIQPGFAGDRRTESVLIPATSRESGRKRRTACVSSQVGCPVGCKFCASGLDGLDGNLTRGQIVEQAWRLARLDGGFTENPDGGGGLTHVVFMGMGEPLVNFKAVSGALETMTAEWGLNLSARRITVSTVGVPAGMRKLADLGLPVTLAISLHAPNDQVRKQIIPWADFTTVEELIDAGQAYFAKTGREVTLEYILLGGLNDRAEHARELADVCQRLRGHVNLIRYNEVPGLPFVRPTDEDVDRFQRELRKAGVGAHTRASRGRDIAAACGQLARQSRKASA
ncbi:MAG: 23S rRNA (adenine(2503)-C(2))-methyltransferase RlmN [Planctomycetota bacterium]